MKGNVGIIYRLNVLLASELAAINQYMVHSEICDNWGYGKLAGVVDKRAKDEMKHAESLIARVVFLEGMPIVSKLDPIKIGVVIPDQISNDRAAEQTAIMLYNDSVRLAVEALDGGTRDMLEDILQDEEGHIDYLDAQLVEIGQMGIQNFLANQV